MEELEERRLLSAYTVISTADDGSVGTLRDAVKQVNAGAYNAIDFQIGAAGSAQTITLTSALPALTASNVSINGLSQGGSGNSQRLIELYGPSAGGDGLLLKGAGCSVSGLLIENFTTGIEIAGNNNTLGGTAAGAGNLISGNSGDGILIDTSTSGTVVQGNLIGTNATGTAALANTSSGIEILGTNNTLGGTVPGARNVISGNRLDGILIDAGASGNLVEGNYIGTDSSGTAAVTNHASGMVVRSIANTIGGSVSAARNVLSGNFYAGVDLVGSGNQLLGNYIGTNAAGTAAVANDLVGVELENGNDTIGGTVAGARNVISGNAQDGMWIDGATGVVVEGNYIGTNANGNVAVPNGKGPTQDFALGEGIDVLGQHNTIGGTVAGARNVISGNAAQGIYVGSLGTVVEGNYIGLNAAGTKALGNSTGVELGSYGSTIGGTASGARNVISGNSGGGILFDSKAGSNMVQGNYIGLDHSGKLAVGNSIGIEVNNPSGATLGGTVAGARNIISGNSGDGVLIYNSGTVIEGNYIGTNAAGTAAVANGTGVADLGFSNTIGGTTRAARNLISGNTTDGVFLNGTTSLVEGNRIGTNAQGSAALANLGYGVRIAGGNNTIGGSVLADANTIADNSQGGVLVQSGSGDTLRHNLIFANGSTQTGPGIVLGSGANGSLAAPVLSSATYDGTTQILTVTGTYTAATANVNYVLEFFANATGDGEGMVFLGSKTVKPTTTGTHSFTFTFTTAAPATDPLITATLTDSSGDTSAFSNGA